MEGEKDLLKETPRVESRYPHTVFLGRIAQSPDVLVEIVLTIHVVDDLFQRHGLLELDGEAALGDVDGDVQVSAVGVPGELEQLAETPGDCEQMPDKKRLVRCSQMKKRDLMFREEQRRVFRRTGVRMSFVSTLSNRLAVLDPCLVNLVHVETRVSIGLHGLASGPCGSVVVEGQAAGVSCQNRASSACTSVPC